MGLVVYAIFHLGVVNFIRPDYQPDLYNPYLWVVIGFLAGFSERFAGDILTRTEATVSGGKTNTKG